MADRNDWGGEKSGAVSERPSDDCKLFVGNLSYDVNV
jgi:RNA recognition motif-containing protein